MALKGIKKNLLYMFALFSDELGQLSKGVIYRKLWWKDYQEPSLAQAVTRMVKTGEIVREVDKRGKVVLKLQAKGGRLLDEVLPLKKLQQKKWDQKWRLVIFDIPEKNRILRNNLRSKLKSLGFGMWQKSVYVTPHNVMEEMNEFLEDKGLFPLAVCFESRRIGYGNDSEFADMIFKTEALNDAYRLINEEVKELAGFTSAKKAIKSNLEQNLRTLWMRYLNVVNSDPFLPFGLLPRPWFAEQARADLWRLIKNLASNHEG